jgi:hypothetical protein
MSNIIVSILQPGLVEWTVEDNPGVINAVADSNLTEDQLIEIVTHKTDEKVVLPDGTEVDGDWTVWMAEEDARLAAAAEAEQASE